MILKNNPAFRYLFLGKISSVFADSVMFFSLLKWIEIQSNGTGAYTLFFVAYYLPITFFALPIGTWIENKTLQKVMVYSNVLRITVIAVFIILLPLISYQWAYLLLIMLSILGLFFMPANQSLLPHVVKIAERPTANSFLHVGLTAVKICGQIFTALMIKLSIQPILLLLMSATLLFLSFIFINQIKPLIKQERKEKQRPFTLMSEGIKYIIHHPQLKALFSFLALAIFFISSVDLILINFLTEGLLVGVENLSFIGTASLIGIAIGAAIAPRWYRQVERKWLIIAPQFALSISIGCLFFISNWLQILPLFFMQGIAVGCYNVTIITYLQDTVSSENYTRTFSLFNMISSSMALPGVLLIGVLLSKVGVLNTIISFSGILFIIGISGIFVFPRLGKGYSKDYIQAS